MFLRHRVTLASLLLMVGTPLLAAGPGSETSTVHLPRPAQRSPTATRLLKRHIAAAAMDVCGASPFSAAETKAAVARSSCWRESYADGIAQMGDDASQPDLAALTPPRSIGRP